MWVREAGFAQGLGVKEVWGRGERAGSSCPACRTARRSCLDHVEVQRQRRQPRAVYAGFCAIMLSLHVSAHHPDNLLTHSHAPSTTPHAGVWWALSWRW